MKRTGKKSNGGKNEMSSRRHVYYKHYSGGIKRGFSIQERGERENALEIPILQKSLQSVTKDW